MAWLRGHSLGGDGDVAAQLVAVQQVSHVVAFVRQTPLFAEEDITDVDMEAWLTF